MTSAEVGAGPLMRGSVPITLTERVEDLWNP